MPAIAADAFFEVKQPLLAPHDEERDDSGEKADNRDYEPADTAVHLTPELATNRFASTEACLAGGVLDGIV